ncbi:uncharacterized protein LOC111707838 isoform X2 [Eurytemora carolleeae]|nr:uncharacterized protein LOC111707838 isoform X2 [Eurytemora carolleeae]|eukprot:XP_023336770.1 uncharacterized protein LOC111707838 isoform X2 [Eurytemora affinis]
MVYQTPYTWSKEGVQVDLMCQTDMPWEWCRWIHMDEYCEWEWISESEGVKLTGCNMVDVDLIGEYNLHQCGVRVMVDAEHEGEWLCEIEKYHPGFSRRYGEVLYGHITLSVIEDLIYTETTPTLSTTLEPATNTTSHTTTSPAMDKAQRELEEYERQFFILKIVVRCGVILTLGGLAIIFGLMFLASWRAFDHNTGKSAHPPTDDSSDDINQGFGEEDPMLTKRLLQTRRKSVAFSVCVLDRDSMTFEMDRKKVLINSTDRIPNASFCPLPTLSEDCETEKIPIPLSLITRHKIRHPSVNRARRMSLPHGPLTEGLLDCVDGTKIGLHCSNPLAFSRNSIETIM